jgi:hypothetical protein
MAASAAIFRYGCPTGNEAVSAKRRKAIAVRLDDVAGAKLLANITIQLKTIVQTGCDVTVCG